jgi:hypothetical protein
MIGIKEAGLFGFEMTGDSHPIGNDLSLIISCRTKGVGQIFKKLMVNKH